MFVFIDFDFGGFVVFVVWVAGFACLFLSVWVWVFWLFLVLYGGFGCFAGFVGTVYGWVWCCCVLVGCCGCLVGFVYFVVLWWLFKLLLDGLGVIMFVWLIDFGCFSNVLLFNSLY